VERIPDRIDAALYKQHNNCDVSQHFIRITVVAVCRQVGSGRHDAAICTDRKINDDVHKSDIHVVWRSGGDTQPDDAFLWAGH